MKDLNNNNFFSKQKKKRKRSGGGVGGGGGGGRGRVMAKAVHDGSAISGRKTRVERHELKKRTSTSTPATPIGCAAMV